ncbi:MAG: outer membrane beta-barrel protein [Candidatus Aminicenantes bacterium]|nr:outer membrane beta-barrel protein [Candidatus Aminicenantes bacterium]
MKRHTIIIFLVLSVIVLLNYNLEASDKLGFDLSCTFGLRTLNNADLKEVYHNGTNFYPSLSLNWHGLIVGLAYEAGFKRNGLIGIYQEPASLSVSGPEFFLGYEFNLGPIAPYLKAGYGLYSYNQKITSEYLEDYPVKGTQGTLMFGGGLKIFPVNRLFIAAEVRYNQIKVKPYEVEVDVGGLRLNGGLGFRF